jgi:hypothetical protein
MNRMSNDPRTLYWECRNCDSGVLIPKGYTQHEVNKHMTATLPCMKPIDRPIDDVIDNKTTIVKPKKPTLIIPGKN